MMFSIRNFFPILMTQLFEELEEKVKDYGKIPNKIVNKISMTRI